VITTPIESSSIGNTWIGVFQTTRNTSNHIISAFQQGHQPFPLVKVKKTNGNTYGHTYHKSFGGRTWLYNSHHLLWGEIDTRPITWSPTSCGIICFAFYILFCKGLEMIGSDKICTASCTYINVLSLCHLYPLPVTWRIQMRTFKRYFSHAILLTTLHLRELS
jgi:hypothetical protein